MLLDKPDRSFPYTVQHDEDVEILKQKSGWERLQIAFSLNTSLRRMLSDYLRFHNPEWNEETIAREVATRISHGNT